MVENIINALKFYKNFNNEKILKINLKNTSWKKFTMKKFQVLKQDKLIEGKKNCCLKRGKLMYFLQIN